MRASVRQPLLTLTLLLCAIPALPDERPWESQPLTSDPKLLAKAAAAATAGDRHDVVLLFEELRYVFDREGRSDSTYRAVYRLQTDAGVRGWSTLSADWAPWNEERPQLQARVVTADGHAHVLDPATIAEVSPAEEDAEVFTDRRQLRAPLPAVAKGAVVEQMIRSVDKSPQFAGGWQYRYQLGSGIPLRRTRVVVDAPESLPLHHLLRGLEGLSVERRAQGDRVVLQVEAGPLDPLPEFEPWMPADRLRRPFFAFSTGASWAAVASAYDRLVDAQIGVTPPRAAKPGARREEIAARLVQRLHAEVRYTGVEFADAAIVPRSPAEVLARKYGDCKDKAALLVSWLRAEGVAASLALLNTGPGQDAEPELPGLGFFDHAIVVLPGTPTLWIDATDEFTRVGELPVVDQDRWALIAAPGTTALVRTPVTTAASNVQRKTRRYTLVDSGKGTLVETTRPVGSIERNFRAFYAHTDAEAIRKSQQEFAQNAHAAGAVTAASNSDPRDLQRPFELRVESGAVGRAESNGTSAAVTIPIGALFSLLPDYVLADADAGGPGGPRQAPFQQLEPHRVEWICEIAPPAGFAVKTLPEPVKTSLGSATLEIGFETRPDGSVSGRMVFDSGPRLLAPEAFEALRSGARERQSAELRVEFENRAQTLLDGGRPCEAIAELRRAAEASPKQSAPQRKLAETLLKVGFGEAARAAASKAVALDPAAADAQRILGWVLEHDLVGRRFKPGSDRAGAEAAYRRARALAPQDVVTRASLAILLEHDTRGIHFGEDARYAEAVVEIEALRKDLDAHGADVNLLLDMMRLSRYAELETAARGMAASQSRDELLLVAVAALRGVPAALAESTRLFGDAAKRRDGLMHAGNSLAQVREYPAAAALLAESAKGADDAPARRARADVLARVKRHQELLFPADDPRGCVQRFMAATMAYLTGRGGLLPLVDLLALEPEARRELVQGEASFRSGMDRVTRRQFGTTGFRTEFLDTSLSLGEFAVDGTRAGGERVKVRVLGTSNTWFVVWRDGGYRVLAFAGELQALGEEAWRRGEAGDLDAARQWLDWARETFEITPSDDPLAGPVFPRLWSSDGPRGLDAIRFAAAALFSEGTWLTRGIQVLDVGRGVVTDVKRRTDLEQALFLLLVRAGRQPEALAAAERLQAAAPNSTAAWLARISALTALDRAAELRRACEERLRRLPGDPVALGSLAGVFGQLGQYDEAERIYAQLAANGKAGALELNNRAWIAVLRGQVTDAALDWARQSSKSGGHSSLHTLATVYAEAGKLTEAQQVLAQGIDASADDTLRSDDWYVVGRLAEQCGLTEQARTAYARVLERPSQRKDATPVLAQRRLAGLDVRPARKKAK